MRVFVTYAYISLPIPRAPSVLCVEPSVLCDARAGPVAVCPGVRCVLGCAWSAAPRFES